MKRIKPIIPSSLDQWSQEEMLQKDGFFVDSYEKLTRGIAELACANPYLVLFYRGQKTDYKRGLDNKSTLLPTIYRNDTSTKEMDYRWKKLNKASELLAEKLKGKKGLNYDLARRKKLIQWSILQHYEVVDTPLIDVTQSIRVACSFAVLNNNNDYAYIYVIGLPYYTNRISVNSEEYLTNIRLISIAPPIALRPYHQEGFLVGEDDIIETNDISHLKNELDLRNRLVYKFKIEKNELVRNDFGLPLPEKILMPEIDDMKKICDEIKEMVSQYSSFDLDNAKTSISNEELMLFLSEWNEIEGLLREFFGTIDKTGRYNLLPAIRVIDDRNLRNKINSLRIQRNRFVHSGESPAHSDTEICKRTKEELREYIHKYILNN